MYRPLLARLAAFARLHSTLLSFPAGRSSSDAPLLFLVLHFLGGSLGSDSPCLRVTWAFAWLFGWVERGAMVVDKRGVWAKGTLTWAEGSTSVFRK